MPIDAFKEGSRMTNQLRIYSYFSVPVDLSHELRDWDGFVSGEGYDTNWLDPATGNTVTTKLVDPGDGYQQYLLMQGTESCMLFHKVVGAVVNLLSGCSDNLMVLRA